MVTYSIKDLMSLCSDYALDAQIQKILFSLDLWVPKAAREVHIDNVSQQQYAQATFSGFNRARSPSRNDSTNNNINSNRLRRTLASRSMSAEVFRSSIDTINNNACNSRIINMTDSRDLNKINTTLANISLVKKSSNNQNLDDISSTGQSQIKLMPILESGENEDKSIEQSTTVRMNTTIPSTIINWTPSVENESTTGRTSIDALFELSVRADTALKTALCENDSMTTHVNKTNSNNDRITLRKSVSVMNQKQKAGSGRSLVRAKSDMVTADASRKRALTHIARASERYFSDDPKMISEIEEIELEYLFNYIRHLKTFPKYTEMTEDDILQEVESDPHTLRQRTKEILKGKMSDSYATYIAKYPIKKQRRRECPATPNKYRKCSRRCFDGQLRTWRRNLHQFNEDSKQDIARTDGISDINENDELTLAL
ncbi:unnamed protein product [Adineta steineri]|uniref:Histone RNA hairpin-binding protein RNA-binding domain-containing protein n=1 Tax=Adineta steineri TaxID=433720 RepID=A0A814NJ57_9BILA|nr:unnamed protein product [Adineta steineri]CAF3487051.1 unnamed protein product [Adineta steineri]